MRHCRLAGGHRRLAQRFRQEGGVRRRGGGPAPAGGHHRLAPRRHEGHSFKVPGRRRRANAADLTIWLVALSRPWLLVMLLFARAPPQKRTC